MLETSPCEVLWEGPMDGRCHCCPLGIDSDQRAACEKKPLPNSVPEGWQRQRALQMFSEGVRGSSLHQVPWLTAWEASLLSWYPEGFFLFTSLIMLLETASCIYSPRHWAAGGCCLIYWHCTIKTHELYCKIHCEAAVCVSYTVWWELLAGWPSV